MDDDFGSLLGVDDAADRLLSSSHYTDFDVSNPDTSFLLHDSPLLLHTAGNGVDAGDTTTNEGASVSARTRGPPLFDDEHEFKTEPCDDEMPPFSVANDVCAATPPSTVCVKTEDKVDKSPVITIRTVTLNGASRPIRPKCFFNRDDFHTSSPIKYRTIRPAPTSPTKYHINAVGGGARTPGGTGGPQGGAVGRPRLVLTTSAGGGLGLRRFGCAVKTEDVGDSPSAETPESPSPPNSERSSSPPGPGACSQGGGMYRAGAGGGYQTTFGHRGRSLMHQLALKHRLITDQTTLARGQPGGHLQLSAEEKRTLMQEGYAVPQRTPLTKAEHEALKVVRRKIKNKLSAQESRRKRKEYMEILEQRLHGYHGENAQMRTRVRQLEQSNRALAADLKRLQRTLAVGGVDDDGGAVAERQDAAPMPPAGHDDSAPFVTLPDALLTPPPHDDAMTTPIVTSASFAAGGHQKAGVLLTAFMLLFVICIPTLPNTLPFVGEQSVINAYFVPSFSSGVNFETPSWGATFQSRLLVSDDSALTYCPSVLFQKDDAKCSSPGRSATPADVDVSPSAGVDLATENATKPHGHTTSHSAMPPSSALLRPSARATA